MLNYAGLQIVEDWNLYDVVEDWSGVRSPARAARRRKRGFPQRIVVRHVPKKEAFVIGRCVHMHPEAAAALRAMVQQQERQSLREPDYLNRPF